MSDTQLVNRFDCCYFNLMLPMHQRMLEDGVDAVIRGTKLCDTGTIPQEGPTEHYDIILPLRDWTHEEVFQYLQEEGAPKNAIYQYAKGISAPECLTCTAWWDDGKSAYLKDRHPQQHAEYIVSLEGIRSALRSHLSDLDREIRS